MKALWRATYDQGSAVVPAQNRYPGPSPANSRIGTETETKICGTVSVKIRRDNKQARDSIWPILENAVPRDERDRDEKIAGLSRPVPNRSLLMMKFQVPFPEPNCVNKTKRFLRHPAIDFLHRSPSNPSFIAWQTTSIRRRKNIWKRFSYRKICSFKSSVRSKQPIICENDIIPNFKISRKWSSTARVRH